MQSLVSMSLKANAFGVRPPLDLAMVGTNSMRVAADGHFDLFEIRSIILHYAS